MLIGILVFAVLLIAILYPNVYTFLGSFFQTERSLSKPTSIFLKRLLHAKRCGTACSSPRQPSFFPQQSASRWPLFFIVTISADGAFFGQSLRRLSCFHRSSE